MTRLSALLLALVGLGALALPASAQIIINRVEVTAPSGIAGELSTGDSFAPALVPVSGEVVLVTDIGGVVTDACEPLTVESAAAVAGKIALVDRGNCRFDLKTQNVGNAGAIGALIANNLGGDAVQFMTGDPTLGGIPALPISANSGDLLRANLPGVEVTLSAAEIALTEPALCAEGSAAGFPCKGVNAHAQLDPSTFTGPSSIAPSANDIWGWTDPASGREFALVGLTDGTAFVEVTTPEAPVYVGKLPTATEASIWRDVKTYANHAFIVSEAFGHGMQVFDLSRLLSASGPPVTFTADALYTGITSAHNIVINEATGFAYAVGARQSGGLPAACDVLGFHAIDVSTPTSPAFSSCFSDVASETGPRSPGYTHDAQCVVYAGPDLDYQGREICFAANEDVVSIFDVSDKGSVGLLSQVSYPAAFYTHQGWLTPDQRYFIVNDEIDEFNLGGGARTFVLDLADLDNPDFSFIHGGETTASDHNLYVHDGKVYQSNYRAGLRVLDATDIGTGSIPEIAYFDTWPESDQVGTTGQWSNYPYFPSGTIVVSDTRAGLFVLSLADDVSPTPSLTVTLTPENPPIVIPAAGGTLAVVMRVENETDETVVQDVWIMVRVPGAREIARVRTNIELAPGEAAERRLQSRVGARALPGTYTVTGAVGTFPDGMTGESSFAFEKATDSCLQGCAATAAEVEQTISFEADGPWKVLSAERDDAAASDASPTAFALLAPVPNPARGYVTLGYVVPEAAAVVLTVYDALGRVVTREDETLRQRGTHKVRVDLSGLAPGVYTARLVAGDRAAERRFTVLR
jgi:choice-of-anchor B domain-containing protein